MSPEEFVNAIELYVRDVSVAATVKTLRKPAGRRPSERLRAFSEWYNRLSPEDVVLVNDLVHYVTGSAINDLLMVFDGASVIDDDKDRFDIVYQGKLLNPIEVDLHDLFQV